jgi:hypothetical protein
MSVTPTLWPYRVRQPMDADAVLDYAIDWSDWLADGEAITAATWTVSGATKGTSTIDAGVTTVWLSAPTGTEISAACLITTDSGRQDERTLLITVAER